MYGIKHFVVLVFVLISGVVLAQKKVSKQFETIANEISIDTRGLDHITLENSNSNMVEVILEAESYDDQLILVEATNSLTSIRFYFEGTETREVVFRKFITKRLQRANAIVKIPKTKKVTVFGENVDITSKSCNNALAIYIDNGIVKLNTITNNTLVKLYSGNIFASSQKSTIDVFTTTGKISVDNVLYQKHYQNKYQDLQKKIKVQSIKANIFLTTK